MTQPYVVKLILITVSDVFELPMRKFCLLKFFKRSLGTIWCTPLNMCIIARTKAFFFIVVTIKTFVV